MVLLIGPLIDLVWIAGAGAARSLILQHRRGLAIVKAVGGAMLILMAVILVLTDL